MHGIHRYIISPIFHLTVIHDSNADAPTFSSEHQATVIAKPHEETQQFGDFFAYITQQETDPEFPLDSEVRYAQTREIQTLSSSLFLFLPLLRIDILSLC